MSTDEETEHDDQVSLDWDICGDLGDGGHTAMVRAVENDKEAGTTLFVASTATPDRAMDVVRQDWRLKNYRRNPVILDNHNHRRVVGSGLLASVPKTGEHAGQLMIRALWDLASPDPTIAAVGHQHLSGFRRAGSVGFRHGKRTLRAKLPEADEHYQRPVKVETPYGTFERSGWLFERNELLEHSSVGVPMNAEALQRALSAGDSAAQLIDALSDVDVDDPARRAAIVADTVPRAVGASLVADLPALLADEATRSAVVELLYPDFLAALRSDDSARRMVVSWSDLAPPQPITLRGDGVDFLFPELARRAPTETP